MFASRIPFSQLSKNGSSPPSEKPFYIIPDPFAPVGAGVVPVARIVSAARDADYGGWFAIEHFGATNMLECVEASASFLRAL